MTADGTFGPEARANHATFLLSVEQQLPAAYFSRSFQAFRHLGTEIAARIWMWRRFFMPETFSFPYSLDDSESGRGAFIRVLFLRAAFVYLGWGELEGEKAQINGVLDS